MDVNTQISILIETLKAMPNSLAKNKVMSALQNARVWSKELDDKFIGVSDQEPLSANSGCICTIGVRKDCPVHG